MRMRGQHASASRIRPCPAARVHQQAERDGEMLYPPASVSARACSRRTRPWTSSAPSASNPARTSTSSPNSTTTYANRASPASRTTRSPRSRYPSIRRLTWGPTSCSSAPSRAPRSWARERPSPTITTIACCAARHPTKAASYNDGDDPAKDEIVEVEETASSEQKVAWRCKMCGYTVEGYPDGLPEDWRCPLCGMGRDYFEKVLI